MWSGLSQFTNALKEQAESVVRESGLDGQLVLDRPSCNFGLVEGRTK